MHTDSDAAAAVQRIARKAGVKVSGHVTETEKERAAQIIAQLMSGKISKIKKRAASPSAKFHQAMHKVRARHGIQETFCAAQPSVRRTSPLRVMAHPAGSARPTPVASVHVRRRLAGGVRLQALQRRHARVAEGAHGCWPCPSAHKDTPAAALPPSARATRPAIRCGKRALNRSLSTGAHHRRREASRAAPVQRTWPGRGQEGVSRAHVPGGSPRVPAALCAPALPSPKAEREINKRGLTVPRVLQAMQNYRKLKAEGEAGTAPAAPALPAVSSIPFWTMGVSSGMVEESMTCSNPAENPGCPEPVVLEVGKGSW